MSLKQWQWRLDPVEGPGGGGLPIMTYTGRLRPKGVPLSGFGYVKQKG